MQKRSKITIMSGPPRSGKSTLVTEMLKEDKTLVRISRDSIRTCIRGDRGIEHEKLVTKIHDEALKLAVADGYNVVLDSTNVNYKALMERLPVWASLGDIEIVYMPNLTLKELKERNENGPADEKLPSMVLSKMRSNYQVLLEKTDEIQKFLDNYSELVVTPYIQDESKPKAIIIDIDDTVARKGHRHHFDWKKVGEDAPIKDMLTLIDSLDKNIIRIYTTGRSEVCRADTIAWLTKHSNIDWNEDLLFMRAKSDFRKATETKKELFEKINKHYHVIAWFDDDQRIIEQFRELGINTLQCK
jgi:predicted kinase